MDEILYLEPDEEITSVIDKLKKSQSKSVGLVIPRNSTLIHSIVNLKLLKKEAESKKKEIAIVTGDKVGKNIATQVGISVYEDVHAKRPINAFSSPELPRGDEVIEVDMSSGHEEVSEKPASHDEPKIKYYADSKPPKEEKPKAGIVEERDDDVVMGGEEDRHESSAKTKERESGYFVTSVKKTNNDEEDERPTRQTNASRETDSYSDHRSSGSRKLPKKGLIVALVIFLIIVLGTLMGLPQTSIIVTVAAEPFERANTITIDKEAKESTLESATVPGRLVEASNTDARRVQATGKKDVGGKAKGSVTLNNAWDGNPIKFNKGTTITSSDGKTFQLNDDVTVPGGTASLVQGQLVTNPGKANANVTAVESGEASNIKAGKLTISGIPSERQSKIFAESSKDFSGGFTKQVAIMTQEDIDSAKDSLAKDLAKTAVDELKKQTKNDKIIEEAITSEVEEVSTNPEKAGEEADYFDIKVKAKHQAMVFEEKAVNDLVNKLLTSQAPEDKELLLGEGDEFGIQLDKTDYPSGKMTLISQIKTKIGTRVDATKAEEGLAGKSESQIKEKLSSIPNLKDVTLYTFPGWWWQDTSFFSWNNRVNVVYE